MSDLENLKRNSRSLRGTIPESLDGDAPCFSEDEAQLLKFHGTYQQDDRDLRDERRKAKLDKAWIMMVRSKIPGGALTAEQLLVHDRACRELGNGTYRITSRQGIQLHGVLKGNLKEVIHRINESGLTTWGACGDVVRNVMATPVPLKTPAHEAVRQLALELKDTFAAASTAYSEIWLDGEKVEFGERQEEPIYGEVYLPRKFKFGIAIPPRNDVDVYTHDVGLAAQVEHGEVAGYTVLAGGGFGMTHNKVETHPALGRPLFYVTREQVVDACVAIVTAQRDYGDREDRKHARLKYLIEDRGLDWFRDEVVSRMQSPPAGPPKPLHWETVGDLLGWHEQGDGRLFCGVYVQDGRVKDEGAVRYREGFRAMTERFGFPMRLTPNVNLYFCDIEPSQKEDVDRTLAEFGIPHADVFTEARKTCMACVALPTCGLALAESERVLPGLMERVDAMLREMGLEHEPILIRMTGCPNGCARPYNADLAFVGRSPGKYAFFAGGSITGERMARLEKHTVQLEEIPETVRGYLELFARERRPGERFSDWWGRTRGSLAAPDPAQFHKEPAARPA